MKEKRAVIGRPYLSPECMEAGQVPGSLKSLSSIFSADLDGRNSCLSVLGRQADGRFDMVYLRDDSQLPGIGIRYNSTDSLGGYTHAVLCPH